MKIQHKNLRVIVQAGGMGTRLRYHTWNKPKCLVSLSGKPLLYHLFDTLEKSKFFIIGDYHYEQLEKYLNIYPPKISYELVRAKKKGTIAGIKSIIKDMPNNEPCLVIWSDLLIDKLPEFTTTNNPTVGTTNEFICRWRVLQNGHLEESYGSSKGVAGLFYFPKSEMLNDIPDEGEFVKWFANYFTEFETIDCPNIKELGDFSTIEELNDAQGFCRSFNKITMNQYTVTKTLQDKSYSSFLQNEIQWYKQASEIGFNRIPKVIRTNPLQLERINGHHLYQMTQLTQREKSAILVNHLEALISLHEKIQSFANLNDIKQVYIEKTIQRVQSISNLIPEFNEKKLTINGIKCANIFANNARDHLTNIINKLKFPDFCSIHGDPTFSNTLVDRYFRVWFIDPRGYFAKTGIMGDPLYDFAKVYYSAIGGYDLFNRKKFKLYINSNKVEILMGHPLLYDFAKPIFKEYFPKQLFEIKILHALIWLSFSGHVKDDVDSIIGAFYLGLYWLEDAIRDQEK